MTRRRRFEETGSIQEPRDSNTDNLEIEMANNHIWERSTFLGCVLLLLVPTFAAYAGDEQQDPPREESPASTGDDLVIVMRSKNEGQSPFGGAPMASIKTTMRIKGFKARTETVMENAPPMAAMDQSIINNGETGERYVLQHSAKTYQHATRADVEAEKKWMVEMMARSQAMSEQRPELEPTGETRVIMGYNTKGFRASNKRQDIVYWIADSDELRRVGEIMSQGFANPTSTAMMLQFPDPAKMGGLPLRTEIASEIPGGGKVTSTVTYESIEWTTLDENLFLPPADYKQIEYVGFSGIPTKPGGGASE